MRQAIYFGPKQRLFGVYHPPTQPESRHAILLCTPLLDAATRSHWVLKNLASNLASAGHAVLRLQYTGHGNSAGAIADCDISTWTDDLQYAATYLRSISAAETKLSAFAPRLSYYLLGRSEVELHSCCAWDPLECPNEWYIELQKNKSLLQQQLPLVQPQVNEYAGYDLSRLVPELQKTPVYKPVAQKFGAVVGPAQAPPTIPPQLLSRTVTQYSWKSIDIAMMYLGDVVDGATSVFSEMLG